MRQILQAARLAPRAPWRRRRTPTAATACLTGEHVHGFLSSSARHACIPKAPVLLHLALAPWRPRARRPRHGGCKHRRPCHGGCDCEPRRPRPGGRMPRPSPRAMEAACPGVAAPRRPRPPHQRPRSRRATPPPTAPPWPALRRPRPGRPHPVASPLPRERAFSLCLAKAVICG